MKHKQKELEGDEKKQKPEHPHIEKKRKQLIYIV
jgi:hypothetical protein